MTQRLFGLCCLIAALVVTMFTASVYKSGNLAHTWPTYLLLLFIVLVMLLSQWKRRSEVVLVLAFAGMMISYLFGVESAGGWNGVKGVPAVTSASR